MNQQLRRRRPPTNGVTSFCKHFHFMFVSSVKDEDSEVEDPEDPKGKRRVLLTPPPPLSDTERYENTPIDTFILNTLPQLSRR